MLPKSIKGSSVEDVKNENATLYSQIIELGKVEGVASVSAQLTALQTQVDNLKKDNDKLKEQAEIRKNGSLLNLSSKAEELISQGKSLPEALQALITAKAEGQSDSNDLKNLFQGTAPGSAGSSSQGSDMSEPKNQDEAIKKIKDANPTLSKRDVVYQARRAYPTLFMGHLQETAKDLLPQGRN